ncbi:unnamed protein product [marine sediment metagenome]|uniref:Transposase zinc-binding domain-containing protein n=1 Tax=marine sediment metagenome TaxID=412755 RepID=X1KES8_9ZZZZ
MISDGQAKRGRPPTKQGDASFERALALVRPSIAKRHASDVGRAERAYVHTHTNQQRVDPTLPPFDFCYDGDWTRLTVSDLLRRVIKELAAFSNMERLMSLDKDRLKFEFRGYRTCNCFNKKCPIETVRLPVIVCGRYHPYASVKHSARSLARALDQIKFVEKRSGSDYMICLDLTCPKDVSSRLPDDKIIKRVRRAVSDLTRKLQARLSHGAHKNSRLGGFYTIHVWATRRPLEPHLHVHLQLFNVAYNSKEKRFHRFKPSVDHVLVKRTWRDALKARGLWSDPTEASLPSCHVRYVRLKDYFRTSDGASGERVGRRRLIHRLKYISRKPIVDLNANLTPDQLEGPHNPAWVRYLLDYTPRHVKIGFMRDLKALGHVCRKSFLPPCPICGEDLTKGQFVAGNCPGLPHFILKRDGTWENVPPP